MTATKRPPVQGAAAVMASQPARTPPNVPVDGGRLHLNEPAFAPSPKVLQAIRDNAQAVARYPDAQWTALRARLSSLLGVNSDQIFCGNGTDELLLLIGLAFLDRDAAYVLPTPAFPRYAAMGSFAQAQMQVIPVRADGACDPEAILAACAKAPRIAMVATPNNPTGQMLSADELTALATGIPAQTLLVIDEAYFEFAQQAGGCDALDVMGQREGHWLVLRTLSKAYALAGLRVGYGVASCKEVVELINRVRTPFNVNALAQIAALAALDDPDYMRAQVAQCAAERERMASELENIGLRCLPSAANFLAVDCGKEAGPVVSALAAQGLFIGALGPTHPHHLRITIGSRDDNNRVISALVAVS